MTSVPTSIPFIATGFPATPGAYLIFSSGSTSTQTGSVPLFCSVTSLADFMNVANKDISWLLMPYYTIGIYENPDYSGTFQGTTQSNTTIQYVKSTNNNAASSVKLYYNGSEVKISGIS